MVSVLTRKNVQEREKLVLYMKFQKSHRNYTELRVNFMLRSATRKRQRCAKLSRLTKKKMLRLLHQNKRKRELFQLIYSIEMK
jgi:hypothetical protein